MRKRKKDATPLLTHWGYVFIALSQRIYKKYVQDSRFVLEWYRSIVPTVRPLI